MGTPLFIYFMVFQYSNWRLKALPDEDARSMNDYIYHITRAKGSGEYCICETFLEPFVLTTDPLDYRD